MLPTTKRSIDHELATESELLADYPVTTLRLPTVGAPGARAHDGASKGKGGVGVGVTTGWSGASGEQRHTVNASSAELTR